MEPICYEVIESVLKDKAYSDLHVAKWIDEICTRVTKDLLDMNKPFKYLGKKYHFMFSLYIFKCIYM